jgi:serine/threonine protein kinase
MACVYHGLHEGLQREVALKELISQTRDAEALSRFRREALALAGFRHQNIVTLYDLVEKGDSLFMVLEHVDGGTLRELLQTGPLPPQVAAVIGLQLADALNHAHFRRIVHRDLKPANVMLTRAGEVKLMDFGVAKDEELEALTQEGMAVGTPAYMAPEQVMGQAVDARTDLFALGVLLYECLAGRRPFTGRTTGETFANIRDGKYLPLQKAAPDAPRILCEVVKKALQPKPEKRYFDASEMARDLERYVSGALKMGPNQLLMACLHQRGKLTETEALAHLTRRELELASRLESATPDPDPESISIQSVDLIEDEMGSARRSGFGFWLAWLTALGATGAVAWATHDAWWPELLRWLAGVGG